MLLPGVPQESILGPILYFNDLFMSIDHSNVLSYADNTKCYKLISEFMDSIKLQDDLNSLSDDLSLSSNLFFNTKKFIQLLFKTKFTTSCHIDDSMIMSNSSHRDLGITLSQLWHPYLIKNIIAHEKSRVGPLNSFYESDYKTCLTKLYLFFL